MAMLVNGLPAEAVSALDRGLAYGDGVFRTLQLRDGRPRLWRWQYARLADDAARLALPLPDEQLLLDELAALGREHPLAVGKITLTRGVGARGYAMAAAGEPTRIVSAAPWAGYPEEYGERGVSARWCELRLSLQPRLAGVKHLNRLESVLARSEWSDPAIQEGLLLDQDGWLAEGTMSNVYLLRDGVIHTPLLDRCGVNGAVRDWLTENVSSFGLEFTESRLCPADLIDADAVFLSNSLIGLWPVARLGDRAWTPSPLLQTLRQALLQQA
ncbi:aminodeoxychorismate lyase [Chromobacterium subtsugae]|uniref:aminodeoxychorismate lyase n=1 Tax=Chromobacterium subtsugae TaxID=251747 RepID=A0ABS7FA58_9NEIS|nr:MULTISPECIES: aminodeoxychorismate lyase [Chromobacterium]KUM04512.1 4-amino-4-deoxychorismate lyase [Chromobacterium subtsugae]KZE87081.1 4-amino-4-deoxychorismate lyase [Chromobacterium sp. F49]MBW7565980.1 aminodeoxychorismate lyase [Chromobacterium subtsugae]MBW8286980.1 aminodeoxychorismate lyase [Chromobacterium subtsugae]WSE93058.1 aminodeoxychorismate lyase [Chromobacterium subtsugae]